MSNTDVSHSVLSIIASFSSGLDVFKRLREKRRRTKKRSKTEEQTDGDEIRLSRSLRQGPEDIGREYQRCSQTVVGEHVAIGDGALVHFMVILVLHQLMNPSLRSGFASRHPTASKQRPRQHYRIVSRAQAARSSRSGLSKLDRSIGTLSCADCGYFA
jgi:hypothetical protein